MKNIGIPIMTSVLLSCNMEGGSGHSCINLPVYVANECKMIDISMAGRGEFFYGEIMEMRDYYCENKGKEEKQIYWKVKVHNLIAGSNLKNGDEIVVLTYGGMRLMDFAGLTKDLVDKELLWDLGNGVSNRFECENKPNIGIMFVLDMIGVVSEKFGAKCKNPRDLLSEELIQQGYYAPMCVVEFKPTEDAVLPEGPFIYERGDVWSGGFHYLENPAYITFTYQEFLKLVDEIKKLPVDKEGMRFNETNLPEACEEVIAKATQRDLEVFHKCKDYSYSFVGFEPPPSH